MDKNNLRLVFMGTPEFSAKILAGLVNDGYNIIGVITEPDKPTGRKMEIMPTPVKKFAFERGLKVFQPEKKINVTEAVKELNPDLVVVAAYGKIITKETLEIPKYGCLNFHGSLLPALRGASPIQTAILEGLEKTGVTIMKMDEGMDTGPILTQVEIKLDKNETTTSLREKMLEKGLPLLLNTIPEYINGKIELHAQEDEATYAKMITKEDGHIDFNKSAEEEERKLRAFNEWPGVYAFFGEKRVKFIEVDNNFQFSICPQEGPANYYKINVWDNFQSISNEQFSNKELGEVFLGDNNLLCLKFKEGVWVVKKLQMEGKNVVEAKDFLNGNKEIIGKVLK